MEHTHNIMRDQHGNYTITEMDPDTLIALAAELLEQKVLGSDYLTSSDHVRTYLKLKLGPRQHEIFGLIFLTNKHQVIGFNELFQGTIDGANVYPREVIKAVLACNAAAVILIHNHPSGDPTPSQADHQITATLIRALETIEVRVLDHMIVGQDKILSFADRGMI